MPISTTITRAIGRAIVWFVFIFMAAAFWHYDALASALAAATAAAFAVLPAERFRGFTLKRKIALLILLLVLAVLLQPDPKQNPAPIVLGLQHALPA